MERNGVFIVVYVGDRDWRESLIPLAGIKLLKKFKPSTHFIHIKHITRGEIEQQAKDDCDSLARWASFSEVLAYWLRR